MQHGILCCVRCRHPHNDEIINKTFVHCKKKAPPLIQGRFFSLFLKFLISGNEKRHGNVLKYTHVSRLSLRITFKAEAHIRTSAFIELNETADRRQMCDLIREAFSPTTREWDMSSVGVHTSSWNNSVHRYSTAPTTHVEKRNVCFSRRRCGFHDGSVSRARRLPAGL